MKKYYWSTGTLESAAGRNPKCEIPWTHLLKRCWRGYWGRGQPAAGRPSWSWTGSGNLSDTRGETHKKKKNEKRNISGWKGKRAHSCWFGPKQLWGSDSSRTAIRKLNQSCLAQESEQLTWKRLGAGHGVDTGGAEDHNNNHISKTLTFRHSRLLKKRQTKAISCSKMTVFLLLPGRSGAGWQPTAKHSAILWRASRGSCNQQTETWNTRLLILSLNFQITC